MNIVFIGSAGVLSEIPLRILLQHGVTIQAIALLESTKNQLESRPVSVADIKVGDDESLSSSASLLEIAAQYQVPVVELPDQLEESVEVFKSLPTDLILMSCFPRRLPASIFTLPSKGCFNLHPSLLPAYRGPSPVHWQCEHKVSESGVTVHQVNQAFDEGAIAVQKSIKTRHCINKVELAYKLALMGGEIFLELIQLIENDGLKLIPQSEAQASYYGFPD